MTLERLGEVLVRSSGMRGLFGVDFILGDGVPWPVEVNPRYTASVEVLEYALGLAALELHRRPFESEGEREVFAPPSPQGAEARRWPLLGKAILFARAPLVFPADGPWHAAPEQTPERLWEAPAYADIPSAGQRIETGRPVLTFFAPADSLAGCWDNLWQMAVDLDQWLWKS
jgi:predicted ATP-grasp superfamily ATP-dependent carboligase